jgi:hypothetical protein
MTSKPATLAGTIRRDFHNEPLLRFSHSAILTVLCGGQVGVTSLFAEKNPK